MEKHTEKQSDEDTAQQVLCSDSKHKAGAVKKPDHCESSSWGELQLVFLYLLRWVTSPHAIKQFECGAHRSDRCVQSHLLIHQKKINQRYSLMCSGTNERVVIIPQTHGLCQLISTFHLEFPLRSFSWRFVRDCFAASAARQGETSSRICRVASAQFHIYLPSRHGPSPVILFAILY